MATTRHPRPDGDFASAAMVRLLVQGMRELGLDPGPAAPAAGGVSAATVPLDEKRRLVGAALAQGGFGCLPLLGRGLHHHAHEPTHGALVSARDPQDLFTRWGRLERYIHSRHRIEVQALDERGARIVHVARAGQPPPLAAEDLVVLGVLVALLDAMGVPSVTAHIGDVPACPVPDDRALAELAQRGETATWTLRWAPLPATPRPARDEGRAAPSFVAPAAWPEEARRSFALLGAHLMNPLPLAALARALGQAPRSLQRQLGRAGLGYTQLLGEARRSAASWWLMRTTTPIAEIGFISGYADQPHFTRDFHRRVGLTPQRFRLDFAATG